MLNIKSFIKKCDFFPETFEFNLNGKGPKYSLMGGIISILTIVALSALSIYSLIFFLNNRRASVVSQGLYDIYIEPSNLNSSLMQFAFSLWELTNFTQMPIKLNSSNITETTIDFEKNSNGRIIDKVLGNFINCDNKSNDKQLIDSINENYENWNASNVICTHYSIPNFEIGGDVFGGHKTSYLTYKFNIDLCDALSECKNASIISKAKLAFGMYYLDYFFNVSDPKGYTQFINNFQFNFIVGQKGQLRLKLIKNIVSTDDNLVFYDNNDLNNQTFYNTDQLTFSQITLVNQGPPNIFTCEIFIKMPFYNQKYTRTYPKIHTFLASINAFCSISLMLAKILIQILNFGNVEFHLMRNLYYIHQPEVEGNTFKKQMSISIPKEKKKKKHSNSIDSIIELGITKEIDVQSQQKIKLIEQFLKGNEFKKEWWSLIKFELCCKKEKDMNVPVKHFLYGKSLLKYDLNILVILKKLIDYENILEILFDAKQLELIHGIHKRKILNEMNIEDTIRSLRHNHKNRVSEQRVGDFLDGFNHCSKNVNRNSQKIIKNIN